jgi:hypothetical protein
MSADEKPPILSIESGEVVPRGRPVLVRGRRKLADRAASGVAVLGETPSVTASEDGRAVVVDTSDLPPGRHRLMVSELAEARSGARLAPVTVDFVVVGTDAPLPEDLVVRHAVRLRVDDLDVTRLAMDTAVRGPYVDAFKAVSRKGRRPVQLAFDDLGNIVDLDGVLAGVAKRRLERFGKLHPALHEAVARGGDVEVAVWLDVPDDVPVEKGQRGQTKRRPAAETKARKAWQRAAKEFADAAHEHGLEVIAVDDSAPVVTGRMDAERVRRLAADDRVGALFLHERGGPEDLGNSIAIANADDAHTAGFTGRGINVAVYENGPDDTTNLAIAARFDSSPTTSDHSRHTHGIVKNVEPNAPHGHAPDCNLHSANSKDLAAIRWAAQDHGCTVISQSFHRDSEQSDSTLSFDDIYKDWTALRWPYPTFCEAAGNGTSTEFVNHKGFNRLTVANHNDAANALASDSVFRNPSATHGDRELPEIAANGVLVTTVGLQFSGTSMAAPAVAGGAALIQQANGTLKSWPEGCRAILMAGAWRNPFGGTWPADRAAGVDARDGAGALDSAAAVAIARNRRTPGSPGRRDGWDVGTSRASDSDASGWAKQTWQVTVPRLMLRPRVKVVLAWDSKVGKVSFLGIEIPVSSRLTVDLDLHVFDSAGNPVASSMTWDNSYEIAEFAARAGETYTIRVNRFSGTDDVWFGVAWRTTGVDLVIDRFERFGSLAIEG